MLRWALPLSLSLSLKRFLFGGRWTQSFSVSVSVLLLSTYFSKVLMVSGSCASWHEGAWAWSRYLRDAGVGRIQKASEQRLSVIRADGGGSVGEEVVVIHALSKKLVKESGRVGRAQGASEPRVLDGNIHSDWRQFGLAQLGLAQVGRCTCSAQSPAGEGREVRQDRENRMLMKSNEWWMFPECFVLCSTAVSSLYTWEPEREALTTIPLEWHYLMVGWAPSAESGLRMGRALLGPHAGATQCHPHTRHQGCQNKPYWMERREEKGMAETMRSGSKLKTQRDFTWVIMHQTDIHISILSVSQWHNAAVLFCWCGWTEGRFRNNAAQGQWSNNNWHKERRTDGLGCKCIANILLT